MDAETFRCQKLGCDASGNSYWYCNGTRLYKEDASEENKPRYKHWMKRGRGRPRKRSRSDGEKSDYEDFQNSSRERERKIEFMKNKRPWSVVCDRTEEWLKFAKKFKNSKSKTEKNLFKKIQENLPTLNNIYDKKASKFEFPLPEVKIFVKRLSLRDIESLTSIPKVNPQSSATTHATTKSTVEENIHSSHFIAQSLASNTARVTAPITTSSSGPSPIISVKEPENIAEHLKFLSKSESGNTSNTPSSTTDLYHDQCASNLTMHHYNSSSSSSGFTATQLQAVSYSSKNCTSSSNITKVPLSAVINKVLARTIQELKEALKEEISKKIEENVFRYFEEWWNQKEKLLTARNVDNGQSTTPIHVAAAGAVKHEENTDSPDIEFICEIDRSVTKTDIVHKSDIMHKKILTMAEFNGCDVVNLSAKKIKKELIDDYQDTFVGNIRVFCRMRPPLHEEVKNRMNMANIVAVSEKTIEIQQLPDVGLNESGGKMQPKYEFSFDAYFSPSTTQKKIFYEISQLVQSALDGYNVCIFAYGQTGSGKTYTMEGPADIVDFVTDKDHSDLGMIPRSVKEIFTTIANLEIKGWKYKLDALFLEIYDEHIRDLLNYQSGNAECEIVKSGSKETDCKISNVTTSEVTSCEQVFDLMSKARRKRVETATKCNEYSSRSHYVFQMEIFGENSITTEKCKGTLNLVDLAGSECIKKCESIGERLSDAEAIDKSLSNLGKVIMSLSRKESHIPYKDSKLTHLLAKSLGDNNKTLMFVNISPDNKNVYETVNSLRFATQINHCNIGHSSKKN